MGPHQDFPELQEVLAFFERQIQILRNMSRSIPVTQLLCFSGTESSHQSDTNTPASQSTLTIVVKLLGLMVKKTKEHLMRPLNQHDRLSVAWTATTSPHGLISCGTARFSVTSPWRKGKSASGLGTFANVAWSSDRTPMRALLCDASNVKRFTIRYIVQSLVSSLRSTLSIDERGQRQGCPGHSDYRLAQRRISAFQAQPLLRLT